MKLSETQLRNLCHQHRKLEEKRKKIASLLRNLKEQQEIVQEQFSKHLHASSRKKKIELRFRIGLCRIRKISQRTPMSYKTELLKRIGAKALSKLQNEQPEREQILVEWE